jgi:hypothetical protein
VANVPETNSPASSVDECCTLCTQETACVVWAWHAELTPQLCHRHTVTGVLVRDRPGCYAGVMNRTLTSG